MILLNHILFILNRVGATWTPHFRLPYNSSYREYDVVIPSLRLLIEIDGDFWHANPDTCGNQKGNLYEVQLRNIENDTVKTNLAKQHNWNIVRFWESDVNKPDFEDKFLNILREFGYGKN